MRTPPLTLAQACTIIDAALAHARRDGLAPLVVVVLDAGGHLIACKREDGAGFARLDLAHGKAWGALGMGFGSRELAERAEQFPTFFAALATTSRGRMVPSPGGVLIVAADQSCVGAVGVSGDAGDHDEACAITGIEAIGLRASPGVLEG
ncbi:GlcG/HbpS family heme-binding protein [Deinococcus hopiensis]|uniref:Uncharacterized conserved protein GlcG, DUF336 family n=1 Tax=Deinococcus hopiensis KR-140 TaxID=695939 RepID=A0A1W1VVN7_9DEIO|nr:heme-binding protein [Deinococcus hopiensis]SMB97408.1 Uncharacterized conserved protein GlcG, DUF336 family [Deinococcus hopiensis KR-140]